MEYAFVKLETTWADEFEIHGFLIAPKKEFDADLKLLKDYFPKNREVYFGTNEAIDFESYDDLMACLEIKTISAKDADVIYSTFEEPRQPGADYIRYVHGNAANVLSVLIEMAGDKKENHEVEDD